MQEETTLCVSENATDDQVNIFVDNFDELVSLSMHRLGGSCRVYLTQAKARAVAEALLKTLERLETEKVV